MINSTEEKYINIHSGHRERLLELAEKVGVANLSQVQQLELLLTYIIPRKDTNPIAHDLLKEFKSFAGVIDADVLLLKEINGMNERSAKLLKIIPNFFEIYRTSKHQEKTVLSSRGELKEFMTDYLDGKTNEQFYALSLDSHSQVLGVEKLSSGQDDKVVVEQKDIVKFIAKYSTAKFVVIGHNHPNSSSKPSQNDIISTKNLARTFSALGVKLLDHIIVGSDGTFSFEANGLLSI